MRTASDAGIGRTAVVLITAVALVAGAGGAAIAGLLGGSVKQSVTDKVAGVVPGVQASPSALPTGDTTPLIGQVIPAAEIPQATEVAQRFLDAWPTNDWAEMTAMLDKTGGRMEAVYGGMNTRLGVKKVTVSRQAFDAVAGKMPFTATLDLGALGTLRYDSAVTVVRTAGAGPRVHFTSQTVYPDLDAGQRLELVAGARQRGRLLDVSGKPLATDADLKANVLGTVDAAGTGQTGLERVVDDAFPSANKRVAVVQVTTKKVVEFVPTTAAGASASPSASDAAAKDIRTTIDLRVQKAAEKALARVTSSPAAIVAIQASTGNVLALANEPVSGLPRALSAAVAPGSTFKIITATAAVQNGAIPSTSISCTPSITVDGRAIKNYEQAASRSIPLTEAFAESCNTAFIRLQQQLPSGALQKTAEQFGFNADANPLPIASKGGSYPQTTSALDGAASAIGQGRVTASPLQMASVAAAVSTGTWRQPRLLSSCDCASNPVPGVASVRPLMRAVVTGGTGTVARGTTGGPVYAKTGTAEYGPTGKIKNHAWFVGWQGDIAFAVYVETGQTGGTTAAPLAVTFLNAARRAGVTG